MKPWEFCLAVAVAGLIIYAVIHYYARKDFLAMKALADKAIDDYNNRIVTGFGPSPA